MDNKIKIISSFILGLFCFVSCAFDGEYHSYERKLNEWTSLTYLSEDHTYRSNYIEFHFQRNQAENLNERIENDITTYIPNPIIYKCIKIIYNNNYILSINGYIDTPTSYQYCKITPTFAEDNITPSGYVVDTLSVSTFNALVKDCKDCQELDADKIRQLDKELDQKENNGFPTKTVKFFFIVLLYIIYRVYKRGKRKKAQKKV